MAQYVKCLDRDAHFLNEDKEQSYGLMYRDNDPVLGWRWRAYPKGSHEAVLQRLREDREGKTPAVRVEPETHSPVALAPLPSPPPIVPVPVRSPPPAPSVQVPRLPLPLLAPVSVPEPAVVEPLAAPSSSVPSFAEQFAMKCAATRFNPLPFPPIPRLSFAEQVALLCRQSRQQPLPVALPPPISIASLAPEPPAFVAPVAFVPPPAPQPPMHVPLVASVPAPAAVIAPPPPVFHFAAMQQSAPAPPPVPVVVPPPPVIDFNFAAMQQTAPAPPPAPLPPSSPVAIERQKMSASDEHLLALDIAALGLSLDDLFSWTTTMQVTAHKDAKRERDAQRDPLEVARRHEDIAPELKRAAIMLRLQVLHARRHPRRKPNKTLINRIGGLLYKADTAFSILLGALKEANSDIFPSLTLFSDALRFFREHVEQGLGDELAAFVGAEMPDGVNRWKKICTFAKDCAEFCEDCLIAGDQAAGA